MKKEDAIKKINQMGHGGQIISNIGKVILIIALVSMLPAIIVLIAFPKNFITMTYNSSSTVSIDLDRIHLSLSQQEINRIMESINDSTNGSIKMDQEDMEALSDSQFNASPNTLQYTFTDRDGITFDLRRTVLPVLAAFITVAMALVSTFFIGSLCKAFRYCTSPFEDTVIHSMRNFAYSLIPWAFFSSTTSGLARGLLSNEFDLFSIDLGMVIVVLVILALAYIFQYGAILQQESDETL